MPKSVSASVWRSNGSTTGKDLNLVGGISETRIKINSVETLGLLGTGSCVSVLSERFYKEHLKDTPLQELKVECADGQELPYLS